MSSGRLVGMCGSLRAGSYNRMLMMEGRALFDPESFVDADLRLPLFDEDIETSEGIPAKVRELSDQIAGADAVFICGPEYNKNISGVLKNALDWISRVDGNPWRDKPVAIASATGGRAGGERTQNSLRLCLNPFRPRVLPGPEVLVAQAKGQFDEDRRLVNPINARALEELMGLLRAEAGLA